MRTNKILIIALFCSFCCFSNTLVAQFALGFNASYSSTHIRLYEQDADVERKILNPSYMAGATFKYHVKRNAIGFDVNYAHYQTRIKDIKATYIINPGTANQSLANAIQEDIAVMQYIAIPIFFEYNFDGLKVRLAYHLNYKRKADVTPSFVKYLDEKAPKVTPEAYELTKYEDISHGIALGFGVSFTKRLDITLQALYGFYEFDNVTDYENFADQKHKYLNVGVGFHYELFKAKKSKSKEKEEKK